MRQELKTESEKAAGKDDKEKQVQTYENDFFFLGNEWTEGAALKKAPATQQRDKGQGLSEWNRHGNLALSTKLSRDRGFRRGQSARKSQAKPWHR